VSDGVLPVVTRSPTLLVLGAAPDSLGQRVAQVAHRDYDYGNVVTAGISNEAYPCDVTRSGDIKNVLEEVCPDAIVCTVGHNSPASYRAGYLRTLMMSSFETNVIGPMEVLRQFSSLVRRDPPTVKKFVAISSNSARIPRRDSLPYCASKAALSMALRVAAREAAGSDILIWGYEPGLLADTPMTQQSAKDFDGALHRIPGVAPRRGLNGLWLAHRILSDLAFASMANNGTMIPFDGGEL
jgi:NAD(P)-dependent dehydrogenase (short-subunit alcohol dehydrogenase family)